MPTEILMPALSPTMEEGTLARWLVKEGDTVSSGDVIAEIETDKATMEFEAVDEGTIGRILVAEGTEGVKVNTPIAVLLEEGESAADISDAPVATAPKAQATAAAEVAPNGAGETAAAPAQPREGTRVFTSPLARRIADQKGLDLAQIKGTGPRGRIVKADVEAAADQPQPAAAPTAAAAPAPQPRPPLAANAEAVLKTYADRPHKEIALDGMRRTIAARLTEAKQTIPHFYLRREIRLDALMAFRQQLNDQLAPRGIKLSVNDFIIKACANALQQVPAANAVWAGDRILQLTPSDVAVAVAIEGGLFTPVLRDAHQKSLSALSAEMKDLATRARDRKLAPQDYQGGSFAISNLGMFGVENFDAVINPPHGAILAVGAGLKKPVVAADGSLAVATVMSVTLSVDHRVIDGALGAELLKAIVEGLENPLALLA
ncbi:pyruvate dehydrogenase complex dihydrolipoamide acetyltransferase [Maliponia aquimaris]|uniref:Acetyltransferase component of pyruvate dehydrogenase complex n=1 Tax=Maliponia aquimaris TaxID=1673631 RepID=A0A238K1B0_9RHOB|nr:pyruvate dehydrogenase complex dihydrolipoamide acetyltransferase [Maliponia aquimaris]SMX36698.1 Dihydrolipoyllysine-residue acetyltransferase component of pyruvate dehydrogenase complex [Maliponia aquimaris]